MSSATFGAKKAIGLSKSTLIDAEGPSFGLAPVKREGMQILVDKNAGKASKSRASPMVELYLPQIEVKTMLVAVNIAHKAADRKRQTGEMRKFAKVRKYLEHMLKPGAGT